jgi:biotin operon repressor
MTTSQALMKLLFERPNTWVSHQAIEKEVGKRSRTAVWKAANVLRRNGMVVIGRRGRRGGYMLAQVRYVPYAYTGASCGVCGRRLFNEWKCALGLGPISHMTSCGAFKRL